MNKLIFYGLQVYCVVVYVLIFCNAGSSNQPKRVVNNQQRLFPLPRVGRGGENSWDYNLGKKSPRFSMMALGPRVGRSDLNALSGDINARSGDPKKMNPNLWFGPRLGRVQKRDIYLYDLPKDYQQYQHDYLYPGSQELRHFNPRLGPDSVEELEESEE